MTQRLDYLLSLEPLLDFMTMSELHRFTMMVAEPERELFPPGFREELMARKITLEYLHLCDTLKSSSVKLPS